MHEGWCLDRRAVFSVWWRGLWTGFKRGAVSRTAHTDAPLYQRLGVGMELCCQHHEELQPPQVTRQPSVPTDCQSQHQTILPLNREAERLTHGEKLRLGHAQKCTDTRWRSADTHGRGASGCSSTWNKLLCAVVVELMAWSRKIGWVLFRTT
jgi:hypothetical protein